MKNALEKLSVPQVGLFSARRDSQVVERDTPKQAPPRGSTR